MTKPMPLSWTTLRSAPLVLALLAGAFLAPSAARAEDCTWGQPGYRDCVDGKIARQRELEAQNKPREVMKTVPASKRPGTLTPLPPPPPAMALPGFLLVLRWSLDLISLRARCKGEGRGTPPGRQGSWESCGRKLRLFL